MNVMNTKPIIGALFALALSICSGVSMQAQQSRGLSFLETQTDARAAAMGNVTLTKTDRNYLYTNPASIFNGDTKLTVSATGLMFKTQENEFVEGKLGFGAASVGYRFLDRHVIYAGFRYQGGMKIKGNTNDQWGYSRKSYTPFDWAVDMGYAFKFNKMFAAYATGSFIQSYTGRVAYAGAFSVGANCLIPISAKSDISVGARVADFGAPINYAKNESYALPTNMQVTADYGLTISENHKLRAVVGGKYYFLPYKAQVFQTNVGAEYTLFNIASLRAGYQYGSKETSLWSVGAGVALYGAKLDFGYLKSLSDFGADRLVLSLSFDY